MFTCSGSGFASHCDYTLALNSIALVWTFQNLNRIDTWITENRQKCGGTRRDRKITCSHDAVQLLMLPPVRHHLEKFVSIHNFNLQNAICLRPFADACLLLLFVVLQHVLQCYIARLMNMHRICTAALPCSCLCSSSRTSDNGNDCCSSGLRLRQQTEIS